MEQNNNILLFIAAAFVVATVFLVLNPQEQTINVSTQPEKHRLDVQGTYEADVAPDEAEIIIGVVTNASTAKDAQELNRVLSAKINDALMTSGLTASEIGTSQYSVQPLKVYNYKLGTYDDYGYEVRNMVRITTKKLDLMGSVIDAASNAGANEINSIQFKLTDEKEAQVRTEFLGKAAANAKSKAGTIASAVGVKLLKPLAVSESWGYTPYYRDVSMTRSMKAEAAMDMAPTPISAENVHVTSTVSMTYEVE